MKTQTSLCLFAVMILLFCGFSKNETGNKPENTKKSVNTVPTLLVIGFEKSQLISNYYGTDYIAEKLGISSDSIHILLNRSIFKKLSSFQGIKFNELSDEQLKEFFYQHISYINGLNNSHEITVSELNIDEYKKMLEKKHSDYLLFISQYQINWSGEPFNTLIHLLNYTLFDKEMNKIYSGQLFFDSEEIESFITTKKAEKKTYQLAQKIEKLVK